MPVIEKQNAVRFFRAVFQGRLHVVEIQNAVRFTLQVWLYVEILDLLKTFPTVENDPRIVESQSYL